MRYWYGQDAIKQFPGFLEAYGRATKLATFGIYGGTYDTNEFDTNEEIFHITFFNKNFIHGDIPKVNGLLSFYSKNIKALVGQVTDFSLTTKHFNIRFRKNYFVISNHSK